MNLLKSEKSPYLLQHQDNPVHWRPWGNEAFQEARSKNKPIFLSIGYSTCHWCHVMEKDSFEKQEVADILNRHFVSIKVDREERPDIDQIYMDAVVAMRGQGGWPLSVFLTPDLNPFFGGTFFWKQQFVALLEKVGALWVSQPEAIIADSHKMREHLEKASQPLGGAGFDDDILEKSVSIFKQSFDSVYGGFGGAPKFPRSFDLSYLLRRYQRNQDSEILKMVEITLNGMARGGMYDHLGGGFARYSTDEQWLIPHFEKMLYDNALLAMTYTEAYSITKNEMYADVARETLDYVLRDMTHGEGGFYSAEDADSEGVEGKFYVWTEEELKSQLDAADFSFFQKMYGVTNHGNFDEAGAGSNVLSLGTDHSWDLKKQDPAKQVHEKLFWHREKRIHPLKDDKILVEWNGLMIAAMAKAYRIFGDERYLQAANRAVLFIRKNMFQNDNLFRCYRDGKSYHDSFLNDYSFLIFGLLVLYEADSKKEILEWALELQKKQDDLFWDSKSGGYFFSREGASDLIIRNKEYNDGAIPSGNSVAVMNLIRFYSLTTNSDSKEKIEFLFKAVSPRVNYYPPAYAMLLMAYDSWKNPFCDENGCY